MGDCLTVSTLPHLCASQNDGGKCVAAVVRQDVAGNRRCFVEATGVDVSVGLSEPIEFADHHLGIRLRPHLFRADRGHAGAM